MTNKISIREVNTVFKNAFNNKINLLIIEDEKQIGEILCNELFISPLFNIKHVLNLNGAQNLISHSNYQWHSWIVDIDLNSSSDGSSLLDVYPRFSYAIVFSGSSTLEKTTQVLKKGAFSAFSKDPAILFATDAFFNEVCKVNALSFVLKAKYIAHRDIFQLLLDKFVTSVEEWAELANVSMRHLQRICSLYIPIAPRYVLQLFHALYFCLREPSFTEQFDKSTAEDMHLSNNAEYYKNCIDTVAAKLDAVYRAIYLNN